MPAFSILPRPTLRLRRIRLPNKFRPPLDLPHPVRPRSIRTAAPLFRGMRARPS